MTVLFTRYFNGQVVTGAVLQGGLSNGNSWVSMGIARLKPMTFHHYLALAVAFQREPGIMPQLYFLSVKRLLLGSL